MFIAAWSVQPAPFGKSGIRTTRYLNIVPLFRTEPEGEKVVGYKHDTPSGVKPCGSCLF